jgi:hypothetical protein
VRSGRALLETQLDSALAYAATELDTRWKAREADLLLLVENEPTRRLLRDSAARLGTPDSFVDRAYGQLASVDYVVLRDSRGRVRWTLGTAPAASPGPADGRDAFAGLRHSERRFDRVRRGARQGGVASPGHHDDRVAEWAGVRASHAGRRPGRATGGG